MQVNWRRGFNRLFVVSVFVWFGYLWLVASDNLTTKAMQEYAEGGRACTDATIIGSGPVKDWQECQLNVESRWKDELFSSSLMSSISDRDNALGFITGVVIGRPMPGRPPRAHYIDWAAALILLGFVVIPPAVMYGLFRLGWATVSWVARGFRPPG